MCAVCSSKSYGEEYYKYYLDIFENLMRKSSNMISDIMTSWLNDCWSQDTWSQCQEVCVCLHLHILLTTRPHIQTLLQHWLLRIAQAVGSETRVVTTSTWHWNTNSLVPVLHPASARWHVTSGTGMTRFTRMTSPSNSSKNRFLPDILVILVTLFFGSSPSNSSKMD